MANVIQRLRKVKPNTNICPFVLLDSAEKNGRSITHLPVHSLAWQENQLYTVI
ncbi:hypothetical protein [Parasphaerochaeta coccoides]|uniref:hypothetical protein n=1 Tax=Parasphaerochaeta coccoides TaxID=273376 RepID=UPI00145D269D|nr:hypothetical protein [Parasphaerochaeta coccoides]